MPPRPNLSGAASLARHKAMTQGSGTPNRIERPSHAGSTTQHEGTQLHVRNIHPSLENDDIRAYFEQYGTVPHCNKIHRHPQLPVAPPTPAREEGYEPEFQSDNPQFGHIYAFVHMSTAAEAAEAIRNLHGRAYMPGWNFTVQLARQQKKKRNRPEQAESPQQNQQKRQREVEEEAQKEQEKEQDEEAEEEGEEVTVNNVDAFCRRLRDRHDVHIPTKINPTMDPAVLPALLRLWNAGAEMRDIAIRWKGRADAAEYTGKLWFDQDESRYQDHQNGVMQVFLANLQANEGAEMDWEAMLKQAPWQSQMRKAILEEMVFLGKKEELKRLPNSLEMWALSNNDIRQAADAVNGRDKRRGEAEFYLI
ncbi:hypothetical protein EJ03DRAFT_347368 [Teratosphaeria nubilosa]|uniref:RRM domain-containing protein n=1 Tax=Teratosphaeria nubilosa TaxID=161662 RepID=A0A6G1LM91_9PEZI|nr:hypothetical protein EJ03DRAFT_347368 [Teratosphaeria nubilosa]